MGFPHPTVDVPGVWPAIADEVRPLVGRQPLAAALLLGVEGGAAVAGHVCATAWVVSPDRTRLLLVRHPRLGWSNPGGHLERHETSAEAVVRELAEETGLAVRVSGSPVAVHVTDVAGDPPHRHWNVAWLVEATTESPLRAEGDAAVRWFAIDDLPTPRADDLDATWAVVADAIRRSDLGQ